jgi:pectate lyase
VFLFSGLSSENKKKNPSALSVSRAKRAAKNGQQLFPPKQPDAVWHAKIDPQRDVKPLVLENAGTTSGFPVNVMR